MLHTKESIKALLLSSDRAVARAVVVLTDLQTAEERSSERTSVLNGAGWNARDAKFGTSLARSVASWGRLTPRQTAAARRMVIKYCGQLARIANAKAAASQAEAEAADREKEWRQHSYLQSDCNCEQCLATVEAEAADIAFREAERALDAEARRLEAEARGTTHDAWIERVADRLAGVRAYH